MLACSRSAATFGWLCVETGANIEHKFQEQAATFGWLCVETQFLAKAHFLTLRSHLRVAVC